MKNREKYREQIMNMRKTTGNFCTDFAIPIILKQCCGDIDCEGISCAQCRLIQAIWLEEEYQEPEVDWSKVPVDAPILVSDDERIWFKRYFAKYQNGKVYVWLDGATSWTARCGHYTDYRCAKLVEEE